MPSELLRIFRPLSDAADHSDPMLRAPDHRDPPLLHFFEEMARDEDQIPSPEKSPAGTKRNRRQEDAGSITAEISGPTGFPPDLISSTMESGMAGIAVQKNTKSDYESDAGVFYQRFQLSPSRNRRSNSIAHKNPGSNEEKETGGRRSHLWRRNFGPNRIPAGAHIIHDGIWNGGNPGPKKHTQPLRKRCWRFLKAFPAVAEPKSPAHHIR